MTLKLKFGGPAIAGLLFLSAGCSAQTPAIDEPKTYDPAPLSEAEHNEVLELLRASGQIDDETRFGRLAVAPEDKTLASHPRQAEAPVATQ